MSDFTIRPLAVSDRDWVITRMIDDWGAEIVVAHSDVFHPADLPGFAAFIGEQPIGLLTYNIVGNGCEIVTLNSWREGFGVGTALIDETRQAAIQTGCRRLWMITTNDNTRALRFYQKRGFIICAIHLNAIAGSRKLKPEIPLTGDNGISIRDEIELEIIL